MRDDPSTPEDESVLVDPAAATAPERENLLLDELGNRLEALQLFRESDESSANAVLEAFGSTGVIEDQMLREMSSTLALRYPERFDEAHRRAMRSLEVFDRNGARPPSALRTPKLVRPLLNKIVQLLITAIVRNHQKRLVANLRQLYALREANAPIGSPAYQLLATARIQVDTIAGDLRKSSLPLPAFLVGGAAISGTTSLVSQSLTVSDLGRYLFVAVLVVLGVTSFWCVLKAAGIARSRGRIAVDGAFLALWEVIGDAGTPPKDQAKMFAVIATLVLVGVWIVVPAVIAWNVIV